MSDVPFTPEADFRWIVVTDFICFPKERPIRAIYRKGKLLWVLIRKNSEDE